MVMSAQRQSCGGTKVACAVCPALEEHGMQTEQIVTGAAGAAQVEHRGQRGE